MQNKSHKLLLVMFCLIYCAAIIYLYNGFQRRLKHFSQLNDHSVQFAGHVATLLESGSDENIVAKDLFDFLPLYDSDTVFSAFTDLVGAVDGEISVTPGKPEAIDAFSMALPLEFEFTGSFKNALKVVGLMETEGQLVRIGFISLKSLAADRTSHNVKLAASIRLIFARAYGEDTVAEISMTAASASDTIAVPQRKMRSDVLLPAISLINNPFQRSIANLTLKSVIPWKDNEFAAVLELETGESFTLVPGESFKQVELVSASSNEVTVNVMGKRFTLVSSP